MRDLVGRRAARELRQVRCVVNMIRREIPRQEWREFLPAFGIRHRGWLTTLEQGPIRISDRPLASVDVRLAGSEIGAVLLRFGDGAGAIQVEAPRAVRLNETAPGQEAGLELESAEGLTRLTFRASALPEALDGIAPSER
jgi:hypothetical protein